MTIDKAEARRTIESLNAVGAQVQRPVRPVFEHGFWWWFDPKRGGWFVGTAPQIQKPTWAA